MLRGVRGAETALMSRDDHDPAIHKDTISGHHPERGTNWGKPANSIRPGADLTGTGERLLQLAARHWQPALVRGPGGRT